MIAGMLSYAAGMLSYAAGMLSYAARTLSYTVRTLTQHRGDFCQKGDKIKVTKF